MNLYKDFLALGYSKSEAEELAYLAENYNEPVSGEDVGKGLRILAVDLAKSASEADSKIENVSCDSFHCDNCGTDIYVGEIEDVIEYETAEDDVEEGEVIE